MAAILDPYSHSQVMVEDLVASQGEAIIEGTEGIVRVIVKNWGGRW